MPKGPPVHEIFNNAPGAGTKAAPFQFERKEVKQQAPLSKKTTLAPLPPMKKFGGYKPKILGGGNDFVPVRSGPNQTQPSSSALPSRPRPVLTKPTPFIIGDKNVPMILSTVDVDEDNNNKVDNRNGLESRMEDVHIYEDPNVIARNQVNSNHNNNNNESHTTNHYNTVIQVDYAAGTSANDRTNRNADNSQDSKHRHPSQQNNNEAFTVTSEQDNLIDNNTSRTHRDPAAFAADNPVFRNNEDDGRGRSDGGFDHKGTESEQEVFIPEPDYDEKEGMMEFLEEDPDDSVEENRSSRKEPRRNSLGMKIYDGEDLSKYLSDDEDDIMRLRENGTKPANLRVQPKYSMFKTKPASGTTAKRKGNKKIKAQSFNSVRNFSFADSKYGTKGKVGGQKLSDYNRNAEPQNRSSDHENFLNTSDHAEGYETFLRSKHGVSPEPGYFAQDPGGPKWNGKQGDGNSNVWKKLTVRLRNKLHGSGYEMKHH